MNLLEILFIMILYITVNVFYIYSRKGSASCQIKSGVWKNDSVEYMDRQIGVLLRPGASTSGAKSIIQSCGGVFLRDFDKLGWSLIQIPSGICIFPITYPTVDK